MNFQVMSEKVVLVSGASGYIASHVIQQLLQKGYKVRGTVRSLKDPQKYEGLYTIDPRAKQNLELVEVPLLEYESWVRAVKDVDYIIHVASPMPENRAKTDDEFIVPAREGTLNALKAATQEKSVKRVVITSSIFAICENGNYKHTRDESNWANPADLADILPYNKSKIIAERAAWAYHESLPSDSRFEMCVVNPSVVLGPIIWKNAGASVSLVTSCLDNSFPSAPLINLPIVDVRDVAEAQVQCLTSPDAPGHRHVIHSGNAWMKEVLEILHKEFTSQGYTIPTSEMTKEDFEALCAQSPLMAQCAAQFPTPMKLDITRLKEVLKIQPIEVETTLIDTAQSLIQFDIIAKTPENKGSKDQ